MHSRKRLSGLVLALVVVTVIGTFTIASAACASFAVSATPNPQGPDQSVTLNVTGFHDQFFNCISGTQLDVFIKTPGAADFPTTANGQTTATDVNGNASFVVTSTSLYETYVAEVRWPVTPSVKATTSFQILPGPAVGTFFISPTQLAPVTVTAGTAAPLGASGMKDVNNKPVRNGTTVSWTLSPGTQDFSPCALAQPSPSFSQASTGVTGSGDTATASRNTSNLSIAGKYDVDGAADTAAMHEDDALIVVPANINSLTATAPASARAGTLQALGASNARDSFNNPAGPASNAKFTFTLHNSRDTDIVTTGQAADACGAASINHQFGSVPADDPFYGVYTWTARSEDAGAKSASTNIDIQPGLADAITTAGITGMAVAGHNATLLASGIVDDAGFAAKTGTSVALSITNPSAVTSSIGTQNVAGVDSGNDNAAVSFTIPGSAITAAGDYTAHVTADNAVKNFLFTVIPDVAVVDMVMSAPNITVGAGNTVTVSAIPTVAKTVALRITRPDGSNTTITNTAQEAPLGDGTFGGQTTFSLTADQLDQVGLWGMSALASNASSTPVGIASGVFTVAQRTLGVTLSTINPDPMSPGQAARTITVSNLPNNAPVARLVITKPDNTTITLNNSKPTTPPPGGWASGSTTFTLPALDINKAGSWTLAASGRNAAGNAIALGNGSFQVKLPVGGQNRNLGQNSVISVTNIPIRSASTVVQLQVTKPDSSSFTVSQTPTATPNNGNASFNLAPASLNLVGTYNVVATVKDGTTTVVVGGTSFTISIAPDALAASANPTFVGALGGKTEITAVATLAGVPVANRPLDFVATHVLTGMGTAHFVVKTNGLGIAKITLIGSSTQLPGDYVVTVRDAVNTSLSTTTTFHVLI